MSMRAVTSGCLWLLLLAGCGGRDRDRPSELGDGDGDVDADADGDSDADADGDSDGDADVDIGPDPLDFRTISPGHGPVIGGTLVELRGNGFTGSIAVRVGGRQVDPVDVTIVDDHRVLAVTPAGEIGPADVVVERVLEGEEAETITLEGGFAYDEIYVDPGRGSIAGGTRVTIIGAATTFDPADSVRIGGQPANEVIWVSPTQLDVRTPPGDEGTADVEIRGPGGDHSLEDGFLYYNAADPFGGGLGGGPLQGTMNVTVLDASNLMPVPEAFVMLGTDARTTYQGVTNGNGQITFSGDDLLGRQMISTSKEAYAASAIVQFDATDVTIMLFPIPDPQPGPPPPGRFASVVRGEVMYFSDVEVGWSNIPDPRGDNEVKVTYVFTSKPSIFADPVPPGEGNTVFEDGPRGTNGWEFDLVARPGAFAVYGLGGLLRTEPDPDGVGTIEIFTPYVMGIARGVLAGPAEEVDGVLVDMSIPLDHEVEVRMVEPPPPGDFAANHYRVDTYLDLGGEGVIARDESIMRAESGLGRFAFPWQPPLENNLLDGRFLFVAGVHSGQEPEDLFYDEFNPFTWRIDGGHTLVNEPIEIGDFLGVPVAVSPPFGGNLVNRRLAWEGDGATPTFQHVILQTLDVPPSPIWDIIVRGDVDEVTLPDLARIGGNGISFPRGQNMWIVFRHTVPNITFDDFSYQYESVEYASAYAADAYILNLP
jgi:hypothetical protein